MILLADAAAVSKADCTVMSGTVVNWRRPEEVSFGYLSWKSGTCFVALRTTTLPLCDVVDRICSRITPPTLPVAPVRRMVSFDDMVECSIYPEITADKKHFTLRSFSAAFLYPQSCCPTASDSR